MPDVFNCISIAAFVISVFNLVYQFRQMKTEEEQAHRFQIDCIGVPHWVRIPNWPKDDEGTGFTNAWGIAFDNDSNSPLPSIYLKATGFGDGKNKPSTTFAEHTSFNNVKKGSWFLRLQEGQGVFELVDISAYSPIPISSEFYTVDAECVDSRGRTWELSTPTDENKCIVWQPKK